MKKESKETFKKFSDLYNKRYETSLLLPEPYTAIAFDWYYPEWGDPNKISVVVVVFKIISNDEMKDFKYKFDILLDNEFTQKAKGSSEPIGLLPKTFSYDEVRQGIFERNLSDTIVTILYNTVLAEEKCIIFQGPFFPKFVGRLGYRHFNSEITFSAVTFRTEWLPLGEIIENRKLNEKFGYQFILDLSIEGKNGKKFYKLADLKPVNGLSEVLKSWGLTTKENKANYVLELFCQFPDRVDTEEESPWIEKLKIVRNRFLFPGLIFEGKDPVWLPFGLACARDLCKKEGRRPLEELARIWKDSQLEYLYFYEEDTEKMFDEGFEVMEVTGRRSILYMIRYKDKIPDGLKKELPEIEWVTNPEQRGLNISRAIKDLKIKGKWDVHKWRRII